MSATPGALCRAALDALYPQGNLCHLCGCPALHEDEPVLCCGCAKELSESFLGEGASCAAQTDALAGMSAAYAYGGSAARLVRALKYRSDAFAALPLGWGMARAYALADDAMRRTDVLVPVPAHPSRLRVRGYNQAELLARALAGTLPLPMEAEALVRVKRSRSQIGLSREQRLANLRGSFALCSDALRGSRVLLIDDVRTTGATAQACAEALLMGGAKSVCLLTACRA